jgi:hypothetical protein
MKKTKDATRQKYQALLDKQEELERKLNLIRIEAQVVGHNMEAMEHELSSKAYHEGIVTDHAALKYLGRKLGLDIDRLKRELVDGREKLIQDVQIGRIRTPEGYTLIVRNGTVVTII